MSDNKELDKKPAEETGAVEKMEDLAINDDLESKDGEVSNEAVIEDKSAKPKKKSVGFAALPEEDLTQHHKDIKKKEAIRAESNPFHKIPPELAYLQRKGVPSPKPIVGAPLVTKKKISSRELGDLRDMPIKVISVQNQNTEINIDYPTISLPVPPRHVLVDVKYSGLNSRDLFKIYQFGLNVSNRQIGLGYEFIGVVEDSNHDQFAKGDRVVGVVDPNAKQGSLSTSLLVNPGVDVLVKVQDEDLEKLNNVDINLCFEAKKNNINNFEIESDDEESESASASASQSSSSINIPAKPTKMRVSNYEIPDELPNFANLVTFPSLFCRAQQVLSHLKPAKSGPTNILINGADSNLGYTLIQIVCAKYTNINLILVVREEFITKINNMIQNLPYDPSLTRNVNVVAFDSSQDELQIPGQRLSTQYKKPDFFATEVLAALFSSRLPSDQLVDYKNLPNYQLDLFIDLIGSKKMFQNQVRFDHIDEIRLPFLTNLSESAYTLFHGQVDEPFFCKLLKPKGQGSAFISACKFETKLPSYAISDLYQQQSVWNKVWGSTFIGYNWFEEINLQVKQDWLEEGLQMVINNQLKFEIDHVIDWRNKNAKTYIKQLREKDRKLVLQIEDY